MKQGPDFPEIFPIFSVVYIISKEIIIYCRKGMDTGQLCQKIYSQITQGILFNAMFTVCTL